MDSTTSKQLIPALARAARDLIDNIEQEVLGDHFNPSKLSAHIEEVLHLPQSSLKAEDAVTIAAEFVTFACLVNIERSKISSSAPAPITPAIVSQRLPPITPPGKIWTILAKTLPEPVLTKHLSAVLQIVKDYNWISSETETADLFSSFYSIFLKNMAPKNAQDQGVINTPPLIVTAIMGGLHFLLKNIMGLTGGLFHENVEILDPACGTFGFLSGLLRLARQELSSEEFTAWVSTRWVQGTFGFEILPASLCVGLLAIQHEFGANVPTFPQIFLMNALADDPDPSANLPGFEVRNTRPISVIFGNPPYNVSTQNKFRWITEKITTYKADLQRLGTKRVTGLKNIQNDYVKFIRFAQWRIERTGYGVVGFIVQNYFLDGLVFRGMRIALRKAFTNIYIVNLHGDMYRGGKEDENLFGIREGVCLLFLVKKQGSSSSLQGQVYYCEIRGSMQVKFQFLATPFSEWQFRIVPEHPDILFIPPQTTELDERYTSFPYIPDIFVSNIQGVVTGHDTLVSHADRESLERTIDAFYDRRFPEVPKTRGVPGMQCRSGDVAYADARDWNVTFALKGSKEKAKDHIIRWAYRGFDQRWLAYDEYLLTRGITRYPLMQYLLPRQHNIALAINRQTLRNQWSNAFVTNCPFDNKMAEGSRGLHSYAFPLKINLSGGKDDFQSPKPAQDDNLRPDFLATLPFPNTPEDVFSYIYGVLFTPAYRARYAARLREDFPRVPFPATEQCFKQMKQLGESLIQLHLLLPSAIDSSTFPHNCHPGPIFIQTPIYDSRERRIYLNNPTGSRPEKQYWIGEIPPEVWTFEIGGILQLRQWLKSRQFSPVPRKDTLNRGITPEEMEDFLKICSAILKTIALYPKLDAIYKTIDVL